MLDAFNRDDFTEQMIKKSQPPSGMNKCRMNNRNSHWKTRARPNFVIILFLFDGLNIKRIVSMHLAKQILTKTFDYFP